ncbi:KAP family NTPase [Pseudoalteromonas shioyasakiensis]|nr:KAP family NTPase [Pseudoalteromonas shioyasakiensis]
MTSTSQSPITSCKYKEWLDEYTFENCKLNRAEYGEFLASYITGEHDGFVLNLNGQWGTGKTQFLRRFYSLLCSKGHPTIYIDAWESDFSDVPLSVVSSELVSQLSKINEGIGDELDDIKNFLGKALKGAVIAGAGMLTKHCLGEASLGVEAAKSMFEKTDEGYLDEVMKNHADQINAIKEIRNHLAQLADVLKQNYEYELPVVVLIDELDRCRPSYSVEMLEVIKHFFTTKNFVFVVATDTEQIKHAICAVYGSEFDSSRYLRRFFHREARLSTPDLKKYIDLMDLKLPEDNDTVILYPVLPSYYVEDTFRTYIYWIVTGFGLDVRAIDQLVAKLNACLRVAIKTYHSTEYTQYINFFTLTIALVEFEINQETFESRQNTYNTGSVKPKFNLLNNIVLDKDVIHETNKTTNLLELCSLMQHFCHEYLFDTSRINIDNGVIHILGSHNKSGMPRVDGKIGETITNSIRDTFSKYSTRDRAKQKVKLWLWKDYKTIVKLAGELE